MYRFIRLLLCVAPLLAALPVASQPADPDTRTPLQLTPAERHLVLGEMRNFVVAMQGIVGALARDDMAAVATAARAMGGQAANTIPPSVVAKLPVGFKQIARKVHGGFDMIALDAESLGEREHTLGQLDTLMGHCIACHSAYRVSPAPAAEQTAAAR